jgi:hypothetical protein
MKYKNIIKLRLPEIQLLAVVPTQLKFSIVKDHDEPTIFLFETLFCMWECFNMGTELPTEIMLGQTLVLTKMKFLNNVRKVGRLVLSRIFCFHSAVTSSVLLLSALLPEVLSLIKSDCAVDFGVSLECDRFIPDFLISTSKVITAGPLTVLNIFQNAESKIFLRFSVLL